jgi:leader peptidase (prepilin peptidase)/N-methyltransferase
VPGASAARSSAPELFELRRLIVGALAISAAGLAIASHRTAAGAAIAAFAATVLVVIAATDIQRRIIPNRIVLPAVAVILTARLVFVPSRGLEFVLGTVCAAGALLIPNLINRSLMGMGDVKLGLLIGATLGWGAIGAITIAFVATFPVALVVLIRRGLSARGESLPFGPFLAFGTLVILIAPGLVGVGAT